MSVQQPLDTRLIAPSQASLALAAKRPRNTHAFAPDPHGHYVEPAWCSARLFQAVDFGPPKARVFDPACGWGRILSSAKAADFGVIGTDIVDRRQDALAFTDFPFAVSDFLNSPAVPDRSWSVVTNPPFRQVREFTELAVDIAKFKAAVLVPLRRLPAARWLQRLPLESIHLLTPRPSMPPASYIAAWNKPGEGTQDFCWLVFNKQVAGGREPRVRWLHRDGGR